MDTSTEKLIRDLGGNISEAIDKISAKLGTTAAHLWEVLCRQAVITGICQICYFIIWSVVCYIFIRFTYKNRNAPWTEEKLKDGSITTSNSYDFCCAVSVISSIIWIILVAKLPNAIAGIFNPEYKALTEVLENIK